MELFFIGLGVLGLALHWPLWLCIVLLAIGGVIFIATGDSSSSGSGWDLDW